MKFKLEEVIIETTKQCNMRCAHCGSSCGNSLSKNELSVQEWISVLKELAEMKVRKVVFSGGEPTIKKGIEEIIAAAHELGLKFGLITNGWAMKKSVLKALKKHKPFAVGVSIDGLKNSHTAIRLNSGSWDRIIWTISDLMDAGLKICAITTITKLNCKDILLLADFLAAAEIDIWQLQLAMPAGRMASQKHYLIGEPEFRQVCRDITLARKKYPGIYIQAADCFGLAPGGVIRSDGWNGCSAGIHGMGIDAEGNVMPCLSLRSGIVCGNVRLASLKEIWEKSLGFDFNRKFKKESVGEKCLDCKYVMNCRGGCASQSFSYFGKFHNAPFCYARSFIKIQKGGKNECY